jgi:Sap, sulfolipid-1-addressing protein
MNGAAHVQGMLAAVSPLAEYVLLALASIFWPLLITIVVIVLRTAHPVRLLAAFLAGGLLATIGVGLALVFSFDGSGLLTEDRGIVDPVVNIVVGSLALIAAAVVWQLEARPREPKGGTRKGGSAERYVENARLAFLAGLLLNVVPGLFPFVALKNVAEGDYSAGVDVMLVVVFYLVMFVSVEIPLLSYLVAPEATVRTVQRLNTWLDRNARKIAALVLAAVGLYLLVRGLLQI